MPVLALKFKNLSGVGYKVVMGIPCFPSPDSSPFEVIGTFRGHSDNLLRLCPTQGHLTWGYG